MVSPGTPTAPARCSTPGWTSWASRCGPCPSTWSWSPPSRRWLPVPPTPPTRSSSSTATCSPTSPAACRPSPAACTSSWAAACSTSARRRSSASSEPRPSRAGHTHLPSRRNTPHDDRAGRPPGGGRPAQVRRRSGAGATLDERRLLDLGGHGAAAHVDRHRRALLDTTVEERQGDALLERRGEGAGGDDADLVTVGVEHRLTGARDAAAGDEQA